MYKPIARFVTRPSLEKGFEKFNVSDPDMIIGCLFREAKKYLKSNCIYELRYNEMTGTLEFVEKGEANIGKRWGLAYFEIENSLGKIMWLTKKEQEKLK